MRESAAAGACFIANALVAIRARTVRSCPEKCELRRLEPGSGNLATISLARAAPWLLT